MTKEVEKFPHVDFIGIGVNKAATTWIHQCLKEHPDICMSKPKETGFFGINYKRGVKWYKERFSACKNERLRGEYTPGYLHRPEVPGRIKKHAPNAKLILCVRNPVNRFVSEYNFQVSHGKRTNKEIDEFVQSELLKQTPERIFEKGLYAIHLKRFLTYFPKEQIQVLIYEDIEKDSLEFAKNIYSFLGVDTTFIPRVCTERVNVTVGNRTRFRFITRTLLSLRRFIKKLPFGPTLAHFLNIIGINAFVMFILRKNVRGQEKNAPPTQKQTLSPEMHQKLFTFYEKDINELSNILNRDLRTVWQ